MEALDREKALSAATKRLEDLRSQALQIEGQMDLLPANATKKFESLRRVVRKLNAEIKILEENPTGVDEEAIKAELMREKAQHQSEMAVADTRDASLSLDAKAQTAVNLTATLEAERLELNRTVTFVRNINITGPARLRLIKVEQLLANATRNMNKMEDASTAANDAAMETALTSGGNQEREYEIKKLGKATVKLDRAVEEAKEERAALT